MRARLAIFKSKQAVELRDVKLTNKPASMLKASPKGTVPILVVPATPISAMQIIDESLDVMLWSLAQSDPYKLMLKDAAERDMLAFINMFDLEFKPCIERYKAAKRYHESNLGECRQACEVYVKDLENRLSLHRYVCGENESLADIAILPFIRQFAKVERSWYVQSSYTNVKRWLNGYLQSAMFNKVMALHPIWEEGNAAIVFCDN